MKDSLVKYNEMELINLAGKEAEEIIESKNNENFKNPFCFWNLKKKILKEKYNIDWITPKEKNKEIKYN